MSISPVLDKRNDQCTLSLVCLEADFESETDNCWLVDV